jgi:hypothetical protein
MARIRLKQKTIIKQTRVMIIENACWYADQQISCRMWDLVYEKMRKQIAELITNQIPMIVRKQLRKHM